MAAPAELQGPCEAALHDGGAAEGRNVPPLAAAGAERVEIRLLAKLELNDVDVGTQRFEAKKAHGDDGDGDLEAVPVGIPHDHLSSAEPADPAASVATRCARILIFAMLCQGVQMFMSYDGGATPASLDTIQAEMDNAWSPAEFGLLGAMDKIGMTATSMLWGRSLQLCNTKLLLTIGLSLNTLCTAVFGSLRSKSLMYAAKFLMGATQSLQGVWATVWTVTMAPPDKKTMWIGLGAVSAGLGNGIGTAVAGFGTANGLPYAFAFQLQAACLAALGLFLLITPAARLAFVTTPPGARAPERENSDSTLGSAQAADSHVSTSTGAGSPRTPPLDHSPSAFAQLQEAWRNKVFCWTGLAISVSMFLMSGIQFLWVRLFVEVWGLDKSWVTLMFLVVTGAGGGVGLALGPTYIDKSGGFHAPPGVVTSLKAIQKFGYITATAGLLGMASLYGKVRSVDHGYLPDGIEDHWLWLMWASIFIIWAAVNASIPALCGINVEVVPNRMRTFTSGTEMTLRNILGYACGPLLPGVFMSFAQWSLGWDPLTDSQWTLCAGFAFVLAGTLVGTWVLRRAASAAKGALNVQKEEAMAQLREALRAEEIEGLERAVAFARSVRLNEQRDGEAVLGMANEAIGAYHAMGRATVQGSLAYFATPTELQRRLLQLEREVETLRGENGDLLMRLAQAEAVAFMQGACKSDGNTLLRPRSPGPQLPRLASDPAPDLAPNAKGWLSL